MPKIKYIGKDFREDTEAVIEQANSIIATYMAEGYRLTLRQLYYQFVSRDLIPNKVSEYKRLGSIISDARLAGLIDWEAIEDRTRNLKEEPHWRDPESIMYAAAEGYKVDKWKDQPYRIELWIEKEALAGVFERVATELDVPFFCCRGYTSQSEMWVAGQRILRHAKRGQKPVILHFGDHDPSGIDMTRDIQDRLALFGCEMLVLNRLALNMPQIEEYDPPPNPAKETDSRFAGYIAKFGHESWELDALEPQVLAGLAREAVTNLMDADAWNRTIEAEAEERRLLKSASERWDEVVSFLTE